MPYDRAKALALCLCGLLLPAGPVAAQSRVWTLTGLEEKKPALIYLSYGVPESDDSFGTFRCEPASGRVTFFLSTTNVRLKPGRAATALLAVHETRTKIFGRLLPNEEAGAPSFEGSLAAIDPLVGALADGRTLTVRVGPSIQSAPLSGQSDKFRKFAAACAKP
jgi:hypothetical protein